MKKKSLILTVLFKDYIIYEKIGSIESLVSLSYYIFKFCFNL